MAGVEDGRGDGDAKLAASSKGVAVQGNEGCRVNQIGESKLGCKRCLLLVHALNRVAHGRPRGIASVAKA